MPNNELLPYTPNPFDAYTPNEPPIHEAETTEIPHNPVEERVGEQLRALEELAQLHGDAHDWMDPKTGIDGAASLAKLAEQASNYSAEEEIPPHIDEYLKYMDSVIAMERAKASIDGTKLGEQYKDKVAAGESAAAILRDHVEKTLDQNTELLRKTGANGSKSLKNSLKAKIKNGTKAYQYLQTAAPYKEQGDKQPKDGALFGNQLFEAGEALAADPTNSEREVTYKEMLKSADRVRTVNRAVTSTLTDVAEEFPNEAYASPMLQRRRGRHSGDVIDAEIVPDGTSPNMTPANKANMGSDDEVDVTPWDSLDDDDGSSSTTGSPGTQGGAQAPKPGDRRTNPANTGSGDTSGNATGDTDDNDEDEPDTSTSNNPAGTTSSSGTNTNGNATGGRTNATGAPRTAAAGLKGTMGQRSTSPNASSTATPGSQPNAASSSAPNQTPNQNPNQANQAPSSPEARRLRGVEADIRSISAQLVDKQSALASAWKTGNRASLQADVLRLEKELNAHIRQAEMAGFSLDENLTDQEITREVEGLVAERYATLIGNTKENQGEYGIEKVGRHKTKIAIGLGMAAGTLVGGPVGGVLVAAAVRTGLRVAQNRFDARKGANLENIGHKHKVGDKQFEYTNYALRRPIEDALANVIPPRFDSSDTDETKAQKTRDYNQRRLEAAFDAGLLAAETEYNTALERERRRGYIGMGSLKAIDLRRPSRPTPPPRPAPRPQPVPAP